MPRTDLRLLTIESFRGSIAEFSIRFSDDADLTVIYGENGSGKTTICDAIEFLGAGKIGSLEDRGLGGQLSRYWPSIGKLASDVKITLETSTDTLRGRLQNGVATVEPEAARPRVAVLRRPQILRLIDAQPHKKYEEISRFVDVGKIEAAESGIQGLVDELEAKLNSGVLVTVTNEEQIARFWEAAGSPGTDAISWAVTALEQPDADALVVVDKLTHAEEALGVLSGYQPRLTAAHETQAAAEAALADARAIEAAVDVGAMGEPETLGILEAAESYLADTEHDATTCPLCRSSEKAAGLLGAVRDRLRSMHELQAASRRTAETSRRVQDAQAGISAIGEQYERDRLILIAAVSKYAELDPLSPTLPTPPIDAAEVGTWWEQTKTIRGEWTAARVRMVNKTQFAETLRATVDAYRVGLGEQKQLSSVLPALRATLSIVREERQRYTDEVLTAISRRVDELYEVVHPGEGGAGLSMGLTPSRRASLDLGSSFGGQGRVPPTAYFSQSHLDTLGICVFLALLERDGPGETILVLDDVLASLDEPHVERLVRMIASIAAQFRHCLVTTHYRPWRERMRWGLLGDGRTELFELRRWSLAGGMQLTRTIPEIERLRADLADTSPDLQAIVSRAGVILEAILEHLTLTYECPLPRKRGVSPYTIGDLLSGVSGRLRSDLRVETRNDNAGTVTYVSTSLTPLLDELQDIAGVRNAMGAHFTELSFELLDDDATRFGQRVLELAELVVDPQAGWPSISTSGSYWATKGDTRRMHPFQRPG
ncbi:MAG: AAA family ATPase [Candidatus Wallbacteria bacterium]|nr:AAA family ATPase [Candidatus Wallbacteria bacterium]